MNKKLLLVKIMKITFLQLAFIIFLLSNAIAYEGSAQGILNTRISINRSNTELKTVLKDIQDKYKVNFMYSGLMIDADRKVTVAFTDQSLSSVLNQVLPSLKLTYGLFGDVVVVRRDTGAEILQVEAKDIVVTGKVTDDKGEALPGVSVKTKGAQGGTSTDANGRFSINVPNEGAVLQFSFLGFVQQEKEIGTAKVINITLQPSDTSLEEVVVVGYGVQKKVNLTGAVAAISGDDLNKRVVTSPSSLLQGRLPGLSVVENSGEPGNEGVSLRIRGTGTFSNAGNDPFVVIDGLPGNLNALNPNDIESISVLKDAASAAIYGTRAANGVILVTTKKGTLGRFSLEYNYNAGITSATKLMSMVTNSVEYMEMFNKAAARQGNPTRYPDAYINQYRNPADPAIYGNYDWQDILFSTVVTNNHYLSANGGTGGTRYNLGLGFVDQPGVMLGFEYSKYTLNLGLNSQINKRVSFGFSTNFTYADRKYPRQGAGEQYLAAITQPPMFGPYTADGTGHFTNTNTSDPTGNFHNKNPLAVAQYVRQIEHPNNLIANLSLKVNVLPGLNWETRAGLNFGYTKRNDYKPVVPQYDYYTGVQTTGNLDVGTLGLDVFDDNSFNPIVYSQLTFDKKLGNHNLTLLGGAQAEYSKVEQLRGYRRGFLTNDLRELNAGGADGQTTAGFANESAISSLYGRLNYNFNQKYLLEVNARYDGSSRFASGQKWALFPSVSAKWRLTQESFVKSIQPSWLSDLGVRASFGRLGNQNIGNTFYPYQSLLNTGTLYPLDNGTALTTGVTKTALVDNTLRWETTEQLDFGLDISLFRKLTINADWFDKKTIDIIRGAQISGYKGVSAPQINLGRMSNKGFEAGLQFNDRLENIDYGIGANFQKTTNKLLKYGARDIGTATIREEGHPLDEFFLYDWIGIFQSQDEINNSPKQSNSPKPGDLKYRDINGDNVIDGNDRTYFSGVYPKFTYSFNLNVGYKRFDLTAFLYGVKGMKNYVNQFGYEPFTQNSPPLTLWRDAWTPENHSSTLPALYISSYAPVSSLSSTFFLKSASFLRLKNVQLGYSVPQSISKRAGIRDLRLYFSGDNLAVFTKYPDLDPERVGATGGGASRFAVYPQNKILSFGARVKF